MNVITTFNQKRYEKQITFERKVLRELSMKTLQETYNRYLLPYEQEHRYTYSPLEENSIDIAIEAYLLGANMGRFGYFGEDRQSVRERCYDELEELTAMLYEQFLTWEELNDNEGLTSEIYNACKNYIHSWWDEGFTKGEKRYRLRLH